MPERMPTAARPVPFTDYPGPSTPGRIRIGVPVPKCPECDVKFTHMHCESCFWLWCDGCRVLFRPDTKTWISYA